VPNRRFGAGGLFKIRQPRGLALNGVAAAGAKAVVLTGSPNNGIYTARYLLP
jgi:hypothetical protein